MKLICLSSLSLLAPVLFATEPQPCAPEPSAPCYNVDTWQCDYCLGPDLVNPAVGPKTCDGDFAIIISGLYWNARQDGLEFAIDDQVSIPPPEPIQVQIENINNLINARLRSPHFDWNFGFKLGVDYVSNNDGWDLGLLWTNYQGRAKERVDADLEDNHVLIPLWSGFASANGLTNYATDIRVHWNLKLNLVDLFLGRGFWTSKYLEWRPYVGLRYGSADQTYKLAHHGGSWSARSNSPIQTPFNNEVTLTNNFDGVGVLAGLSNIWHIGRGFSFYSNLALSLLYGRFHISEDENNRLAQSPFSKTDIFDVKDSFHATRAVTDVVLGIQWSTRFSDCQYVFTIGLDWEQHIFFNQNQLWRIARIGDTQSAVPPYNNTGENVFNQRRGDLTTQGWTLTFRFDF